MSVPIGQDGKALRLCTDRGCTFYLRHVENCPACFGWGTAKEREGATHQLERFPPLPAAELADALASEDWLRCPDCGGTPNGIVEEDASA